MGLQHNFVLPVKDHLNELTCTLCTRIVAPDAVVTKCHHPFCKDCFDDYISRESRICPTCGELILDEDDEPDVAPLSEAEPLAHRILMRVKVMCPHRFKNCCWSGNYSELPDHIAEMHPPQVTQLERARSGPVQLDNKPTSVSNGPSIAPPSLPTRSKSSHFSPPRPKQSSPMAKQRSQSTPRNRNKSTEDVSSKSGSTRSRHKNKLERSNSGEMSRDEDSSNNSDTASPKARKKTSGEKTKKSGKSRSGKERKSRKRSKSSKHLNFVSDDSNDEGLLAESRFVAAASNLKMDANVAFKEGNYKESISLYSTAIASYKSLCKHPNEEEKLLVSTLYANRAASYLRTEKYEHCLQDCNRALKLNKYLVKACRRKAWALAELGRFDEAEQALLEGLSNNPESKDLKEELERTREMYGLGT